MNATLKAIEQTKESTRNWYDDLLKFAKRWIKGKDKFTSEDIVAAWNKRHDYRPSEPRVFGAVMLQLKRDGLIRWVSYCRSKSTTSHTYPKSQWKSLI